MQKKSLIFFVIVSLLSTASARSKDVLEFLVRVSPVAESASKNIGTTITIKNVGQNSIYVYKDLNYLVSSFASTKSGEEIPRSFVEEVTPPPPQRDSFLLLGPGELLSLTRELSLVELGICRKGMYSIKFRYTSQFSPSYTYGLSVWRGSLDAAASVEVIR